MKFNPRRHQNIAIDFLREHDRACLFLDMGLGKTVCAMTVAREKMLDEFTARKFLVIAPKRVAEDTWSREAAKWDHLADLRVSKVLGTTRQRMEALKAPANIYIINRENVVWLIEAMRKDFTQFDGVIIDELSSFKSPKSKRWKALKTVIGSCRYVWGLTGTPAPNGYMDLWSQIYLIDRGDRLGRSLGVYQSTYFRPGAMNGHVVYKWSIKPGAKQCIDQKLQDICLSMQTEDWVDLPERIYNDVVVKLDAEARKTYERMKEEHILPMLEDKITSVDVDFDHAILGDTAAALSNKLLQMAGGAVYNDERGVVPMHSAKLDALDEILESTGDNVLLFYNYQHERDRIMLRHPEAVCIDEPDAISRWCEGNIRLLLAHCLSAGHGLNLQSGGHTIVWFSPPWSLEGYQQANKRLHRMGQQSTVIIHHIICEHTLDERVIHSLTQKDAVQDSLLKALKSYVKEEVCHGR